MRLLNELLYRYACCFFTSMLDSDWLNQRLGFECRLKSRCQNTGTTCSTWYLNDPLPLVLKKELRERSDYMMYVSISHENKHYR